MKNRFVFLHSINFKIGLSFILILIVTIEIIGAYFVRQLEDQNVANFENSVQVPAYTINQISENLTDNDQHTRDNINNAIQDYTRVSSDITDVQVIDRSGIIVGTKDSMAPILSEPRL